MHMIADMKKIARSVGFAWKGLRHAYRSDKSFRLEVVYGLPAYLCVGWMLFPFAPWEFLLYLFSYLFILTVELVNTAFEKMLDRVHPEDHELIGKSKDISSAAVLVAFLFAIAVVVVLVLTRLSHVTLTPFPFA
mgnify:FL=1